MQNTSSIMLSSKKQGDISDTVTDNKNSVTVPLSIKKIYLMNMKNRKDHINHLRHLISLRSKEVFNIDVTPYRSTILQIEVNSELEK